MDGCVEEISISEKKSRSFAPFRMTAEEGWRGREKDFG
jgi:hypothetical protein